MTGIVTFELTSSSIPQKRAEYPHVGLYYIYRLCVWNIEFLNVDTELFLRFE